MAWLGAGNRSAAERLYGCTKGIGKAFLLDTVERDLVSKHAPMLAVTIHPPDAALRLGYVLTVAAYTLRSDSRPRVLRTLEEWWKEVLARQQLAMHRRMFALMGEALHDKNGRRLPYLPPTPSEREPMRSLVETHTSHGQKAIEEIVSNVRSGGARPLKPAYGDLVGCFGGPGSDEELEDRYGTILAKLFDDAKRAVAAV